MKVARIPTLDVSQSRHGIPGPFDTSPRELALERVGAEMQDGEGLRLAPVHRAPVIPPIKMDDASNTCSTPKAFGIPDDRQNCIATTLGHGDPRSSVAIMTSASGLLR